MELFQYLDSKFRRSLIIKIGNYVSHEIINDKSESWNSDKRVRDVDFLNSIDRFKCALNWYKNESLYFKEDLEMQLYNECIGINSFLSEVAMWMDERIPKSYIKHKLYNEDKSPAQHRVVLDEEGVTLHGLIFHYEYGRGMNSFKGNYQSKPTTKQIDYLKYLAVTNDFKMVSTSFSKREASMFIAFFLNECDEEPENLHRYFSKSL